jgi:serine phosphatase RsbU (regulator of sigma subunit)
LVKQFSSKEKIDNDIRFGQKILKYFINNEYSSSKYAYIIKPAFHFSGDYVRIFDLKKSPLDESVVVSKIFFIADVSGKGIGAILIVNQLNLFFDIYSDQIWDLNSFEEILNKFNQYFLEKNKTCDFIAFRSLYVDYEKKETSIIDAGLPQIYCLDSNNQVSKISLEESYTPLGIDENEYYKFKEIFLFAKYNNLFLCTDGILEQSNENGVLFEEEFVIFLKNNYNSNANNHDFIKSLWDDFYLFIQTYENQQDDFTVLIVNL